MEFQHERLGKCVCNLTQKQHEEYSKEMLGKGELPMAVWRGDSVRCAMKLGIITEPKMTEEEVDSASPALIRWLSDVCLVELIKEANDIDPLS